MDPHSKLLLAISDILRNSYPTLNELHAEVEALVNSPDKSPGKAGAEQHDPAAKTTGL